MRFLELFKLKEAIKDCKNPYRRLELVEAFCRKVERLNVQQGSYLDSLADELKVEAYEDICLDLEARGF